jgi:hypothetical protein
VLGPKFATCHKNLAEHGPIFLTQNPTECQFGSGQKIQPGSRIVLGSGRRKKHRTFVLPDPIKDQV